MLGLVGWGRVESRLCRGRGGEWVRSCWHGPMGEGGLRWSKPPGVQRALERTRERVWCHRPSARHCRCSPPSGRSRHRGGVHIGSGAHPGSARQRRRPKAPRRPFHLTGPSAPNKQSFRRPGTSRGLSASRVNARPPAKTRAVAGFFFTIFFTKPGRSPKRPSLPNISPNQFVSPACLSGHYSPPLTVQNGPSLSLPTTSGPAATCKASSIYRAA